MDAQGDRVTPAYAYLRVSGLAQVEGDGFPRQELAINKYATANDIQVVKVYREEGVSGKNELDGRPALRELIADLLSNGTRLVLIEKLDRLARSLIIQETILQDLTRRGITLISVSEPDLCTDDPTRTLVRQILGSFFEYERKMIVLKTRAARERIRLRDGKCEGRKAFGANGDERERKTLEIILRYKDALQPFQIANILNANHFPTRMGKRWHGATISKILSRPNIGQNHKAAIPQKAS
jgi:DNA invertase Pin-like site-specific DNA recombinase